MIAEGDFCFTSVPGEPAPSFGNYYGEYDPMPGRLGDGGTFMLILTDGGSVGHDKEDMFTIELVGGIYDGYFNTGNTKGGNISFDD